ncbi:MAG TPA: hypothetical protein VEU47_04870 [Candidatus Cybelea sp.]|nr:hypothetical protein [Candidatus Cybelea sp.]
MESFVYDRRARIFGLVLVPILFVPVIWVIATLPDMGPNPPSDLVFLLAALVIALIVISLYMIVAMGVRVSIDSRAGTVSRTYKFLGWTFRRTGHRLSQFDRVSLHRVRGTYRATLLGRESEVVVGYSSNQGYTRRVAEDIARFSGLKMVDRL